MGPLGGLSSAVPAGPPSPAVEAVAGFAVWPLHHQQPSSAWGIQARAGEWRARRLKPMKAASDSQGDD